MTFIPKKKATVLWTGGKDSALAFFMTGLADYEITSLTTFVPEDEKFLAHPLSFLQEQADALKLELNLIHVNEPYRDSYEKAICKIKDESQVDALVTGDISEVDGYPNWIRECSKTSGIEVLTPLWHSNRLEILNKLIKFRFRTIFSCVKKPWFTKDWIGTEINNDSIEKLIDIEKKNDFDICGENGEYHTLVLDGPIFKKGLYIRNDVIDDNELMYIDIKKVFYL